MIFFEQSLANKSFEITDDKYSFSFEKIEKIWAYIDSFLSAQNISLNDCLVLRLNNTLLSAFLLLYLLDKGYSFVIQKLSDDSDFNNVNSETFFTRYDIYFEDNCQHEFNFDQVNLKIVKNENWNGFEANKLNPQVYLQTSGSTGNPKLVVHSHPRFLQNSRNCLQRLNLKSSDRITIPVPISHLYGLGAAFLPAIMAGASVNLQSNANILKFLQTEKKFNPNIAFMTPSFAKTLLKARKSPRHYDFTVIAGDRISPQTFDEYEAKFGKVIPLYGSTEMGVIAIANAQESKQMRQNTVGKPLDKVELKLEKNQINQLFCKHQFGFDGYIDKHGNWLFQTKNEWFATKDLAEIDEQGYLKILGRSDYCVNRDGLLVLLTDIEKAIETVDGVEKAIAITNGETMRGKKITACCLLEKNSQVTSKEIKNRCFQLLTRNAIPDEIKIVSELPLLPNGKVDRQRLAS